MIRFLFPLLVIITAFIWFLDIPPRWKRIALGGASALLFFSGTIFVFLLLDNNPEETRIIEPIPFATLAPAPTRPPEGPGFETACKAFRTLHRDVEGGVLNDFNLRSARVDVVRSNAVFSGSPQEFRGDIENYADLLDRKYGQGRYINEVVGDTPALEREIRRTRDDILSECLAREE